ncbi:MAG: ComF family protein [Gemmatimonadetes bacterium]|nr:ComF family protein [Gemmatimonadota bacterium]NIO32232.1 ComF family protein [Gemmatimonadota bacterium]
MASVEWRVCGLCWARARAQRHPRCDRCGIALYDSGISIQEKGIERPTSGCIECADWLPYLRVARAPYTMSGTAAAMVHALKYGGWADLADEMGARMAEVHFAPAVEAEIGALVPVPLSPARLRERGFNQAELLGRAVARRRGWPLIPGVLVRGRHTRRQARLAPRARADNVAGAFGVLLANRAQIEDAHLLLVDDVLTTAATAQACVRALCGAGARAVSVLTFARARRELPRKCL